jgi:hypothetical protein
MYLGRGLIFKFFVLFSRASHEDSRGRHTPCWMLMEQERGAHALLLFIYTKIENLYFNNPCLISVLNKSYLPMCLGYCSLFVPGPSQLQKSECLPCCCEQITSVNCFPCGLLSVETMMLLSFQRQLRKYSKFRPTLSKIGKFTLPKIF